MEKAQMDKADSGHTGIDFTPLLRYLHGVG